MAFPRDLTRRCLPDTKCSATRRLWRRWIRDDLRARRRCGWYPGGFRRGLIVGCGAVESIRADKRLAKIGLGGCWRIDDVGPQVGDKLVPSRDFAAQVLPPTQAKVAVFRC